MRQLIWGKGKGGREKHYQSWTPWETPTERNKNAHSITIFDKWGRINNGRVWFQSISMAPWTVRTQAILEASEHPLVATHTSNTCNFYKLMTLIDLLEFFLITEISTSFGNPLFTVYIYCNTARASFFFPAANRYCGLSGNIVNNTAITAEIAVPTSVNRRHGLNTKNENQTYWKSCVSMASPSSGCNIFDSVVSPVNNAKYFDLTDGMKHSAQYITAAVFTPLALRAKGKTLSKLFLDHTFIETNTKFQQNFG